VAPIPTSDVQNHDIAAAGISGICGLQRNRLYRATFATAIRYNTVSFNLSAQARKSLEKLTLSVDRLSAREGLNQFSILHRRCGAGECVEESRALSLPAPCLRLFRCALLSILRAALSTSM
jgi:hypothetical protein